MPKGTPNGLKCPKCKRGMWREPRPIKGVVATGELQRYQMATGKGYGSGRGFLGHRGGVKCLDCGHEWFSTHTFAKPIRSWNCGACRDKTPLPHDPIRLTDEEAWAFSRNREEAEHPIQPTKRKRKRA